MSKKLISIVVPVYNEEENVETCYQALTNTATQLAEKYDFEFIFTDNCSKDTTFCILRELAKKDSRVKAFRFSKNFGYQRSIFTGYTKASGDAAIAFDADLQDPPELLPEFLKKWEEGHEVVYGIRIKRKESRRIELTRKLFYRIINKLSPDYLPQDAGDFRLIDKKILNQLKKINEARPYIRGIIANLGFRQVGIPYERNERTKGESKFNLRAMMSLAIDGIISQSFIPLRFATYTGLAISLLTFLGIIAYLIAHIFYQQNWPPGFTTTVILILFSVSLNALFLGIIGEYLARIYSQVLNRPFTIIAETTEE